MNTKTPAYQMLVLHAVELAYMDRNGVDYVAGLVVESHSQTITDRLEFKADVRKAYSAAHPWKP